MKRATAKLIGPFAEMLSMLNVPAKGAVKDDLLEIKHDCGIVVLEGIIRAIGDFTALCKNFNLSEIEEISSPQVCLPGFIDVHTHMCWAGSRARDYSLRTAGVPYLEIAKSGGGIMDTVRKTRQASETELLKNLLQRCTRQLKDGVTTCEVKSGYGLTVQDELKMLRTIDAASKRHAIDLVPTCLAAHMPPPEFKNTPEVYLQLILDEILPVVQKENLARRIDIFIEESAFSLQQAEPFLQVAQERGFSLAVHVDQFSPGGSLLACKLNASSADHLEAGGEREIKALANSNTVAVILPGCSLGLGINFAPARKLLDGGAGLAISTDWNPGSAPMGDLLMQAAVLGAAEKLSSAETFAGITCRAAAALGMHDRGVLAAGMLADFQAFPCHDFREILYHQGKLKADKVWKRGVRIAP